MALALALALASLTGARPVLILPNRRVAWRGHTYLFDGTAQLAPVAGALKQH